MNRAEPALLPCPTGGFVVPREPERLPELRLSLVLPTSNEAHELAALLHELGALLEQALPGAFEVIVVDDDSEDGTWSIALSLSERHAWLRVVRRESERGLASAVVRGWQLARGDVLAVMDADRQHPPELVLALLQRVESGADLALASRHVTGGGVSDWSLRRRLISRGAQLLGFLALPEVFLRSSDPLSGLFAVTRASLAGVPLAPRGYKILLEVLARSRVRQVREVGYVFRERVHGASKVRARVYLDYCIQLLELRLRSLRARVPDTDPRSSADAVSRRPR